MKIFSILILLLGFIILSPKIALAKSQVDDDTGSVLKAEKILNFRADSSGEESVDKNKPAKSTEAEPSRRQTRSVHRKYLQEEEEVRTPYKEAQTGYELRKLRRVGIGLQAAGALGVGGAVLDLNFAPQLSVTTGFGGGQGFNAFEIQAKYVLAGDWLMPYLTAGYARWSSIGSNGPITNSNPPFLADRLLNSSERATGEFAKNLLYPGIGLQFTQLDGPWAGSSVYAEFNFLLDVINETAAPTGSLGFAYYF